MGTLVYSMITSLDGYVEDGSGSFAWAQPGPEVFDFVVERTRTVGTSLMGRRMFELMQYWDTDEALEGDEREFALAWQGAEKVVFSTTLPDVGTRRTTLERSFDAEAVSRLVAATDGRVTIDGPTLAAHALRAGIVDEVEQYLLPVAVGGGIPFYPTDLHLGLRLLDSRTFDDGTVWLHYECQ